MSDELWHQHEAVPEGVNSEAPDSLETEFDEQLLHVQHLAWALLDDHITDEERQQLNDLLTTDTEARATYIDCVQLHVDLYDYYCSEQGDLPDGIGQAPIVPSMPPLDLLTLTDGGTSTSASE